jgi:enoyl-CoA hydratase
MLAESDGPIGWMTFNKSAGRNAVSVNMWQTIPAILDRFKPGSAAGRLHTDCITRRSVTMRR